MKRTLLVFFVVVTLTIGADAQSACPSTLADCPAGGCGKDNSHDPKLNTLKNVTTNAKATCSKLFSVASIAAVSKG